MVGSTEDMHQRLSWLNGEPEKSAVAMAGDDTEVRTGNGTNAGEDSA
jgi:hypothetical protein